MARKAPPRPPTPPANVPRRTKRLAAIASHRPDTEPSWLDRPGRGVAARLRWLDEAALREHALATAAVAAEPAFGFVPHTVRLMGALALLEGRRVEMATPARARTVTVAMAAVVAVCRVITANEYLAPQARAGQSRSPCRTMPTR